MAKDYIEYSGKRYRVECNFNAITEFLEATGKDTFDGLAGIAHLKPSDLAPLMAASINEGERIEGRECKLTGKDVGTWDITIFGKFVEIYGRQSSPDVSVPESKKKESRKAEKKPQSGSET